MEKDEETTSELYVALEREAREVMIIAHFYVSIRSEEYHSNR